MIIKILGILDILVGVIFWLSAIFHLQFLSSFVFLLGLFLLAKGIVFATNLNVVSILDIFNSIIILIGSYYTLPALIIVIVALFLLQKGIFSMLG